MFSSLLFAFVLGADVSWVTEMEKNGATFREAEGAPCDCFTLMKKSGLDAVRLRVWVDPKDGFCNRDDTVAKAVRAQTEGLAIMVDFHYSDGWADPGRQSIPKAWRGHDVQRLCADIAAHTKDVLGALREADVEPKWVQVGNETTYGFLWEPKCDAQGRTQWEDLGPEQGWVPEMVDATGCRARNPQNYARFFKAGYAAVKEVFPRAQVIVHLDSGEKFELTERNLETLRKYGATWDMVGLSVYPRAAADPEIGWDRERFRAVNGRIVDEAIANIAKGAARWKCPYMIVETGAETNPPDSVGRAASCEFLGRLMRAARTLPDGTLKGVFYWEPACTPAMYDKGAFGADGRPTELWQTFTTAPVKVIFDTDMYTDYDDAGALAMLHALMDAGECELLATVTCSRDCHSVAMCEIVNSFYGRPEIPVGCAKGLGPSGMDPMHVKIYGATVGKYAKWVRHLNSNDAPDALDVYRRVLAAQPDHSVVICSVGFFTNLRRLVESDRELVARKVKRWVAMACAYPNGKEYNAGEDWESTKIALEKWPTPVVFTDFQYGRDCFAGRRIAESGVKDNPVADVFAASLPTRAEVASDPAKWLRWCSGAEGHASWDETAVLIAVRGTERYFNVSRGTYRMVGDTGEDEWVPDEAAGPHIRITEKVVKSEVGKVIDALMCRPPAR